MVAHHVRDVGVAGSSPVIPTISFMQAGNNMKEKEEKKKAIITCPYCGYKKEEEMPADACTFFYECEGCRKVLKPREGDCCVFCSYGSEKCPPRQNDSPFCACEILSKDVKK